MTLRTLPIPEEVSVEPFIGVASVEEPLLKNEYLVIREGERFHGVLTRDDVIRKGHNLVIDCLTPKSAVNWNEDLFDVLRTMRSRGEFCLPVFDDGGRYVFTVTRLAILRAITEMEDYSPSICLHNIVGSGDLEQSKRAFFRELFHNIQNPLQIIQSSADLLASSNHAQENEIYRKAILSSATKIDTIITKLYERYF